MAHFAELDENDVVLRVLVVSNETITVDGIESEQAGIDFLQSLLGGTRWKQTSYNAKFRKNYAGIGYTYDPQRDAFIPPSPYPSWVLDETNLVYVAPKPYPNDGRHYVWDETSVEWTLAEDPAPIA